MRKLQDSKVANSPAGTQPKKASGLNKVDIYAALLANGAVSGIGGILRPVQEAVNTFSQPLYDRRLARPPYTPCLLPKLAEAPWATQHPDH